MIKLGNKAYDALKWFITIFLPGVGAVYFALAQTFDFSRIPGVNGTINVMIVVLGVIARISTKQYNNSVNAPDGDLIVMQDPETGEKHVGLGVNGSSLEDMTSKDTVKLTVIDKTQTDPRMAVPPSISTNPGGAGSTAPGNTKS